MKKLMILTVALGFSCNLLANEYDETTEMKCYQEAEALGCTTKDGEQVESCLEKNQAKLTPVCKAMQQAKSAK